MAHNEEHTTPEAALLEEALTVLFCQIDDAYRILNPNGHRYGSLKKLSDSEVLTLALFQQLRGIESERSFLREATRFPASSPTSSRGCSASILPRCTAAFASSGA